MKASTREQYHHRIMTVVDYIWSNIDKQIDINLLADVACFSPYHFHRIYREMMHETVAVTVRRLRLHYAAYQLLYTDCKLADLAKQLNYGSAEAFIRAFSQYYGASPASYRASKQATYQLNKRPELTTRLQLDKDYPEMYQVEIKTLPKLSLGGLAHQGSYLEIGQAFEKLSGMAFAHNLFGEHTRMLGMYFDDPESKPIDELDSFACITCDQAQAEKAGLQLLDMPAGQYAVLVFKGPYAELEPVYQWFYGNWLPESGHEPADAPAYEEYLNSPRETAPADLLTAIHIPLKGAQ